MYIAYSFSKDQYSTYFTSLRAIRERECTAVRDEKARKMMQELNDQRRKEGKPSPRQPILTCSKMAHLPKLNNIN